MQTYIYRNNQDLLIIFDYQTNHSIMRNAENRLQEDRCRIRLTQRRAGNR